MNSITERQKKIRKQVDKIVNNTTLPESKKHLIDLFGTRYGTIYYLLTKEK